MTRTGWARATGSTPSSGSSPTAAAGRAPRASPSTTPTREMGPGASGARGTEKPPVGKRPGAQVVGSRERLTYLGGRILNMPVPHTGHTPFRAGRPFPILTYWPLEILRFALHFTQYPSSAAIGLFPAFAIALLWWGAGGAGTGTT